MAYQGSESNYMKLHYWIRKNLGRASICSFDSSHKSSRYDWANISGKYKKDLDDYMSLCRSCHVKMDFTSGRSKIHLGNKYAVKPVVQYTKKGELIKKFSSLNDAAKDVGIVRTAIGNCLTGYSQSAGGYKWRYL